MGASTTWNLYAYANSEPVNGYDPTGFAVITAGSCLEASRLSAAAGGSAFACPNVTFSVLATGIVGSPYANPSPNPATGLMNQQLYQNPALGNPGIAPPAAPPSGSAVPTPQTSPCNNLVDNGGVLTLDSPVGDVRLEFNGAGNLTGISMQLTGANAYSTSGLYIPANTAAAISVGSPGTVMIGFSNPVTIGSGVSQASILSTTFSGTTFTSVQGAITPFGIPLGSPRGDSQILRLFLNGSSTAGVRGREFWSSLASISSLVSRNVTCQALFGNR